MFDRFADYVAEQVHRAWFFVFCVLLVLFWAPTLLLLDINTSQLIINTATTIITFLLVALLHNTQHRFEKATNERLCNLEDALNVDDPVDDPGQQIES